MSILDETHDPARTSRIASANGHPDFPIQNLAFGIFAPPGGPARAGVAIGDLIGTGTISGPRAGSFGSLLEIGTGGKTPVTLPTGETRIFLEDGDELSLHGLACAQGHVPIGFGPCRAIVAPAR